MKTALFLSIVLSFSSTMKACERATPNEPPAESADLSAPATTQPVTPVAPNVEASAADAALTRLDHTIAFHEERASGWLDLSTAAAARHQRAQLSGRYDDFREARRLFAAAFARAPERAGPFLGRASLRSTLHQFALAEEDLAAAEAGAVVVERTRQTIEAARADIAFAKGDYAAAEEVFRRNAEAPSASATDIARFASYQWKTGLREEADATLLRARESVRFDAARTIAWVELQRGLIDLEAAAYQDALRHYRRADEAFSGWYLVQEHIAETLGELGRRDEAIAIYRDVIARTESPELMGALAGLLAAGNPVEQTEATTLIARAEALYEDRLREFPEALAGHAFDHFLEHGAPDRAVSLAERNHELRPSGESKVQLGQAYLRAGRLADAAAIAESALTTPYRTVDLHALVAVALTGEVAEEHARLANAIREGAVEEMRELIPRDE